MKTNVKMLGIAALAALMAMGFSGCKNACTGSSIAGCTPTSGGGYKFPDGVGGTVTCDKNGVCKDSSDTTSSYNNGYNTGNTAGSNASGYNAGYNAGYNVGYNQGNNSTNYNNGWNHGYNDGVWDSPTYGSGYSDGAADGYNSGYPDGSYDGAADGATDGATAGATDGYNDGYNSGYGDGYNDGADDYWNGLSVGRTSKDTDLMKSRLQARTVNQRAEFIASQFQMSFEGAKQLTQLSDKVQQMGAQGALTAADRAAITQSALKIAGVGTDEVDHAMSAMIQGDTRAADDLMAKAAKNLGMPSSAGLRDKLLPALGIETN
jgi:hypothetical protein